MSRSSSADDRRVDLRRGAAVELVLLGVRARRRRSRARSAICARSSLVARGSARPRRRLLGASTSARRDHPAADQLVGPELADALLALDRARTSRAACRPARPTRCGRSGGSRSGRSARRGPSARGRRTPAATAEMQASTSSALTWMIGMSKPLARSEAQRVERASSGSVVKPIWLLVIRCSVPPTRVAVERLQVERLGDDALAGEGRVAVDHDRDGAGRVAVGARARRGCSARRASRPSRPGQTYSRCEGLDSRLTWIDSPDGERVGALGAVVVLDVAGAALRDRRHRLERRGALELGEDRLVGAAEVVREHVEAPAVGHPDDDLARAAGGGRGGSSRRASAPSCRCPRSRTGAGRGRPCA